MKTLTERHRRKFIYKWLLQSPCDFESYCRNYVAKHYKFNLDIFFDLEDTIEEIVEELGIDEETDINIEMNKPAFLGEIQVVTIENSSNKELKFWVKKAKVGEEEIEEFLLNINFLPTDKFSIDLDLLEKLKQNNFRKVILPHYCKKNLS